MYDIDVRRKLSSLRYQGGITTDGYKRLNFEEGRIKEHRYIAQKALGRELNDNEVVHHINGDRLDNRVENLKVMLVGEHASLHAKKTGLGKTGHQSNEMWKAEQSKRKKGIRLKEWIKKECPNCGDSFEVTPYKMKQRFCCSMCFLKRDRSSA